MTKRVAGVAVAALAMWALAGCTTSSGGSPPQAEPTSQSTTSSTTSSSTSTSTPTETVTPQPTPSSSTSSPSPTAPAAPVKLRLGDRGAAVLALQNRLTALGYWLGTPDGKFGGLTQQAVYAVQKAAGLGRDGVAGAKTQAALTAGKRPRITTSGSGHRVEINKKTQLLLIIDGSKISTILNTSTGSGRPYLQEGHQEIALTPSGKLPRDPADRR